LQVAPGAFNAQSAEWTRVHLGLFCRRPAVRRSQKAPLPHVRAAQKPGFPA